MTDENNNGNGQKRRMMDKQAMERAAENSVVKLSSRLAMVIITTVGLPLVGYLGHRMVAQLDTMSDVQVTLAKDVAVIAVEVKGIDRRVRTLEWSDRRSDRDDDRPGVRQ